MNRRPTLGCSRRGEGSPAGAAVRARSGESFAVYAAQDDRPTPPPSAMQALAWVDLRMTGLTARRRSAWRSAHTLPARMEPIDRQPVAMGEQVRGGHEREVGIVAEVLEQSRVPAIHEPRQQLAPGVETNGLYRPMKKMRARGDSRRGSLRSRSRCVRARRSWRARDRAGRRCASRCRPRGHCRRWRRRSRSTRAGAAARSATRAGAAGRSCARRSRRGCRCGARGCCGGAAPRRDVRRCRGRARRRRRARASRRG